MVMVVVLIILLVLPGNTTKLIADAVVVTLFLLILVEGYLVGNKIKKLAAERFPGQTTQGVTVYATMRGISLRPDADPQAEGQPGREGLTARPPRRRLPGHPR